MDTKQTGNTNYLQEYYEKDHAWHVAYVSKNATVAGRIADAIENTASITQAFKLFLENEITKMACGVYSPVCIIYMPQSDQIDCEHKKGKILIETRDSVSLYFELNITKQVSDFSKIKHSVLDDRTWTGIHRYYDMKINYELAEELVQVVLFSPFFRQRFLMTMQSRALGEITTQQLLSPKGHVFSFRNCVLNE